jgi:RNA polymerase sigma-70 factor (ECF subfamily)
MKAKNPKITEEEIALIKSAQAGDMSAFNKLYYRYSGFTTNLLHHFLKDYDEARDINNIVWDKVYRKLSKFADYSSFGGWLRVLTNRTAIDYLRELKPQKYVPQNLEDPSVRQVQEVDYGESSVDKVSYNQILELFKQFPEDVRRVFELHYIDNLTVSEISDITKIPPGTVKSHLFRKRKLLKQQLKL